jgi:iron complex transport system substrate-binding protein
MHRSRRTVAAIALLVLALVATACGSDGPDDEPAAATSGGAFPVTMEHAFGSTTIDAAPERVVAIGFNEQDFVLALGVTPVGVREFLGYDATKRPWAEDLLPDEPIPTVGADELDLEEVAALHPDLILGIYSFVDEPTYEKLSKIAPTVVQRKGYEAGTEPWDEQTLDTGKALGRQAEAEQLVEDVQATFAEARKDHPELAGKVTAVDYAFEDQHYILEPTDLRMRFFADLGLKAPEQVGELSKEQVGLLDQDLLVVVGQTKEELLADPVFASIAAVREGRAVFFGTFDSDFAAALGFGSPLSFPFAIDEAVPQLAAAVQ